MGSDPDSLTNLNGVLYFRAYDNVSGALWRNSSSGIAELVAGVSNPNYLTIVNGTLYFSASDGVNGGVNGRELWRINSSGIAEMVEDAIPGGGINPGLLSSNPGKFTNVNGTLFFEASDLANGRELWRINSSGTAEMVEDAIPGGGIKPGAGSPSLNHLTNVNGTLYFDTNPDDSIYGPKVWRVNSAGIAEIVPTTIPAGTYFPERAASQRQRFDGISDRRRVVRVQR